MLAEAAKAFLGLGSGGADAKPEVDSKPGSPESVDAEPDPEA